MKCDFCLIRQNGEKAVFENIRNLAEKTAPFEALPEKENPREAVEFSQALEMKDPKLTKRYNFLKAVSVSLVLLIGMELVSVFSLPGFIKPVLHRSDLDRYNRFAEDREKLEGLKKEFLDLRKKADLPGEPVLSLCLADISAAVPSGLSLISVRADGRNWELTGKCRGMDELNAFISALRKKGSLRNVVIKQTVMNTAPETQLDFTLGLEGPAL